MNLAIDVERSAARYPDSIAIRARETLNYQDFLQAVREVSGGLRNLGVSPGDPVLYSLQNGAATTILFYSILHAGAIAVPTNPLLSQSEFADIRGRVGPCLTVSDGADRGTDILLTEADEFQALPHGKANYPAACVGPTDPAVVFFTSGTTGRAKGVVLSHQNLSTNADWVATRSLSPLQWGPAFASGVILPLSHSFALTCSQNAAIRSGAAVAPLARFNGPECLEYIRRHEVTVTALVPSAAKSLVEAWREDDGPVPLRTCMIGGAPIDSELIGQVEACLGATVVEGYGLTETSPVCAFRSLGTPRKPGSVGRVAGYAKLGLRTENGIETTGTGELAVQGPGVFERYLDSPTTERHGEWFMTGDVATIDDDGDVFIVDRLKDMIIRNGYNVSPVEVERSLATFPGVLDAGVVGIADPNVGEEIAAFLVLERGDCLPPGLNPEAVGLSKYKWPRRFEFVSEIPRGTKGQVLRGRLKSQILT